MTVWPSKEIEFLYRRLIVSDVARHIPGKSLNEINSLTDKELITMVNIASILALDDDPEKRTFAYEIVTRVLELAGESKLHFATATEFILVRLGNFPCRELLRQRYLDSFYNSSQLPLCLKLEEIVKEKENSTHIFEGEPTYLTDFQYDFLYLLTESQTASISAPTSAGKSFVLSLDVIKRLKGTECVSIVYIVPTRALIRQVMKQVTGAIRKASLKRIPVRCVPLPVDREKIYSGAVYVFTPERLMSFLHTDEGEPWITDLFIDEAQTIGDGARGIILQSAIDYALSKFPSLRLYFASPFSKNPEYLPTLFMRPCPENPPIEEHSPVSQNIILASNKPNSRKQGSFELVIPHDRVPLGERKLDFSLSPSRSPYNRKADFAKAITGSDECTIIYVNFPTDAIAQAKALISDGHSLPEIQDVEVLDFIDFIKNHIHEDYDLSKTLKYGVAFHYGNMPPILRSQVEDLFADNKLRFICCTSTLLQGVNLPAKSIVIEKPKKGRSEDMERIDFQNLAGRAGRLLKEFQGNVWCLNPEKWGKPCYEGESLHEIRSAFADTLADGGKIIQNALEDKKYAGKNEDLGIMALSKVLTDYILSNKSLLDSPYRTEENKDILKQTTDLCQNIFKLPDKLLRRNQSIHPKRLQELFNDLDSRDDISDIIPIHPQNCNRSRVEEIFKILYSSN